MQYLWGQLSCTTPESWRDHCGSGFSREHRRSRCHSPCWILRGHARSHSYRAGFRHMQYLWGQLSCTTPESWRDHCGSGLAPRTPAQPVPFTVLDSSRVNPLPQVIAQASGICSTCGGNCPAQHLKASAIIVGAGLPREHRRSRCHSPCWILRG